MPRRWAFLLAGLLAPALLGAAPTFSDGSASFDQVTVADLLADPAAHAGTGVAVGGELVGDFGVRDDGSVWTQLNGDPYAGAPLLAGGSLAGRNAGIGVHIPAEVWPGFDDPGGYRVRGPLVELRGMWRYHDPERGGESYLEVIELRVLEPPLALHEGMRWAPLGIGAGLLGAALGIGLARRRRRAE